MQVNLETMELLDQLEQLVPLVQLVLPASLDHLVG